jgi:hypothetical protein
MANMRKAAHIDFGWSDMKTRLVGNQFVQLGHKSHCRQATRSTCSRSAGADFSLARAPRRVCCSLLEDSPATHRQRASFPLEP